MLTPFQIMTIVLMVATGTLNTVSAGLQLAKPALNKIGEYEYFEHYFIQTLFMMLGESMCMIVYGILRYIVFKDEPSKIDGEKLPMNPLVLWPAALLDIVATTLGYMGLGFMRNPGFFQMLRVTPMIFCGLLSMPILKRKLKLHNWIGMVIVCAGLVIKAFQFVPQIYHQEENEFNFCAKNMTITNPLPTETPPDKNDLEKFIDDAGLYVGMALVVVGEFFHGLQFVYEEKYLTKYNLPPLMCVGYEGINGVITLLIVLWPLYFIIVGEPFGLGPEARFEDAIDGFHQIFAAGSENGGWLLGWTFGNMCSIAVFNFAGITVMRELSATTRAVLDQLRIIFIWIIFLPTWGIELCRLQDKFTWPAPIGLAILVIGVFIYLDVIIMPFVRKYILKQEDPEEKVEDSRKGVTVLLGEEMKEAV